MTALYLDFANLQPTREVRGGAEPPERRAGKGSGEAARPPTGGAGFREGFGWGGAPPREDAGGEKVGKNSVLTRIRAPLVAPETAGSTNGQGVYY